MVKKTMVSVVLVLGVVLFSSCGRVKERVEEKVKAPKVTVGYWRFDESEGEIAKDFSGKRNDGTIYGATTTAGKIGQALSFDGVNDYVDVGNDIGLGTEALSVSAWVKMDSWPTVDSSKPFVSDWNTWITGSQKGFLLRIYSCYRYPTFIVCNGTNYHSVNSSQNLTLGEWYHVVGTFEANGYQKIYVNGVERGTVIASNQYVKEDTTPICIGCGGINAGYFNGAIDEVRIYNRALTSEEAKNHYESGSRPDLIAAHNDQ